MDFIKFSLSLKVIIFLLSKESRISTETNPHLAKPENGNVPNFLQSSISQYIFAM